MPIMDIKEILDYPRKQRKKKIIQYSIMMVVALIGSAVIYNAIPKLEEIEEA